MRIRSKFIYKWLNYEFWPWWAMFIPVLPAYLYSVLATRRLLYFTTVNPSIPMGGFFGEFKDDIMDLIPDQYKAKTVSVRQDSGLSIRSIFSESGLELPVVVKPNVGERGYEVCLIHTEEELKLYADKGFDFIIQERLTGPIELGILYSKLKTEELGKVSSISSKEFMTVIGDGRSTVLELIRNHHRHFIYERRMLEDYPDRMVIVPKLSEVYKVHSIGNHIKGTRFIDETDRINSEAVEVMTTMANQIKGIDYGRYDLKIDSWDEFYKGKGIKIFEINGVSSEPGHLYDQQSVFQAYRILYQHWFRLYKISKQNLKLGVRPTPMIEFIKQMYRHFWHKNPDRT